jgi:hypothetical protein
VAHEARLVLSLLTIDPGSDFLTRDTRIRLVSGRFRSWTSP